MTRDIKKPRTVAQPSSAQMQIGYMEKLTKKNDWRESQSTPLMLSGCFTDKRNCDLLFAKINDLAADVPGLKPVGPFAITYKDKTTYHIKVRKLSTERELIALGDQIEARENAMQMQMEIMKELTGTTDWRESSGVGRLSGAGFTNTAQARALKTKIYPVILAFPELQWKNLCIPLSNGGKSDYYNVARLKFNEVIALREKAKNFHTYELSKEYKKRSQPQPINDYQPRIIKFVNEITDKEFYANPKDKEAVVIILPNKEAKEVARALRHVFSAHLDSGKITLEPYGTTENSVLNVSLPREAFDKLFPNRHTLLNDYLISSTFPMSMELEKYFFELGSNAQLSYHSTQYSPDQFPETIKNQLKVLQGTTYLPWQHTGIHSFTLSLDDIAVHEGRDLLLKWFKKISAEDLRISGNNLVLTTNPATIQNMALLPTGDFSNFFKASYSKSNLAEDKKSFGNEVKEKTQKASEEIGLPPSWPSKEIDEEKASVQQQSPKIPVSLPQLQMQSNPSSALLQAGNRPKLVPISSVVVGPSSIPGRPNRRETREAKLAEGKLEQVKNMISLERQGPLTFQSENIKIRDAKIMSNNLDAKNSYQSLPAERKSQTHTGGVNSFFQAPSNTNIPSSSPSSKSLLSDAYIDSNIGVIHLLSKEGSINSARLYFETWDEKRKKVICKEMTLEIEADKLAVQIKEIASPQELFDFKKLGYKTEVFLGDNKKILSVESTILKEKVGKILAKPSWSSFIEQVWSPTTSHHAAPSLTHGS